VRVRYQADADLKRAILLATTRQEPAVDFASASAARLAGLADREVLGLAASAGRILVTHDVRTMPLHFAAFVKTGRSSGVILVPQHLPIPEVAETLILIWAASEAAEWVDRICRLPL
jgi:hypothetical protein